MGHVSYRDLHLDTSAPEEYSNSVVVSKNYMYVELTQVSGSCTGGEAVSTLGRVRSTGGDICRAPGGGGGGGGRKLFLHVLQLPPQHMATL